MKTLSLALLVVLYVGVASAQQKVQVDSIPIVHPDSSTMLSIGFGSTVFPTPILASQSLAIGGGGIIGGNFSLTFRAIQNILPHWRIPFSLSVGFLRGQLLKSAVVVPSPGDTVATSYDITNSVNVYSAQVGIEYYYPQRFITLSGGVDFMYSYITPATLDWVNEYTNADIVHQTLPQMSRWGVVLRAGGECPLPADNWYFVATTELGAVNLFGRGDSVQVLTPTQNSKDISAARLANGQTGEDIATFFRLIVGVAYRF